MLLNINTRASVSPKQRIDFIYERIFFDVFSAGLLSPYAVALYSRLFAIDNGKHWVEWFEVSNAILMEAARIHNRHTLAAARAELIKAGFILYQPGAKGYPGKYQLVKLYDPVPEQFRELYRSVLLRREQARAAAQESAQDILMFNLPGIEPLNESSKNTLIEADAALDTQPAQLAAPAAIPSQPATAATSDRGTMATSDQGTMATSARGTMATSDQGTMATSARGTMATSAQGTMAVSDPPSTVKSDQGSMAISAQGVRPNLAHNKDNIDRSDKSDLRDSQPLMRTPSEKNNNIRSSQVSVEPKNKAIGSNTAAAADQTRPDKIKCSDYMNELTALYTDCYGRQAKHRDIMQLMLFVKTYGLEETREALLAAKEGNAYSLNYVLTTLKNLHGEDHSTGDRIIVGGSEPTGIATEGAPAAYDAYNDDSYYDEDSGLYPGLDPYGTAGIPQELLSIMDQEITNEKKNKPAQKRSDAK